jgi:hypothetical protein
MDVMTKSAARVKRALRSLRLRHKLRTYLDNL